MFMGGDGGIILVVTTIIRTCLSKIGIRFIISGCHHNDFGCHPFDNIS
jgi:hypothetical protein